MTFHRQPGTGRACFNVGLDLIFSIVNWLDHEKYQNLTDFGIFLELYIETVKDQNRLNPFEN